MDSSTRSANGFHAGPTGAAAETPTPAADRSDRSTSIPDPLLPLLARLAEARAYVALYVSTCIDEAKVSLEGLIARLVLLALLGLAGATAIVVSVTLALAGMAGGIGAASGHGWIGQIVVGGGVLLVIALASLAAIARRKTRLSERILARYAAEDDVLPPMRVADHAVE